MDRPSAVWSLLLGILSGLLITVRGNYVAIMPAFIFIVLLFHRPAKSYFKFSSIQITCLCIGLIIAISPFVVRNYKVAGKLILVPSQAGFNLYLGNNPDNKIPYYRPVSFASSSPFYQGTHFTIEASRRVGRKLSPSEASDYWSEQVIEMAK